jgi:predicted MFS family arabinose efflux permease
MGRAPRGHEGRYMALYTMTFSGAHIASSKLGMEIIDHKGYNYNWEVMAGIGLFTTLILVYLYRMVMRENA